MGVYSKSHFSGEKSSGSIRRKEKEAGSFPAGGFTMKASRKRVPWQKSGSSRGKRKARKGTHWTNWEGEEIFRLIKSTRAKCNVVSWFGSWDRKPGAIWSWVTHSGPVMVSYFWKMFFEDIRCWDWDTGYRAYKHSLAYLWYFSINLKLFPNKFILLKKIKGGEYTVERYICLTWSLGRWVKLQLRWRGRLDLIERGFEGLCW